jgi:putative nucleotidyltransferase with HDIG domain
MEANTITLDDIIHKTTDLPTIPAATLAVMHEAESSTSSAQSVARKLSQDQSLTARVLRLANSAFYGLSRKVMDPQEAVVVLGMRSIRNLAIVASTYPWLVRPLKGYQIGPNDLWAHSFGVAIGASMVAKRSDAADPDAAFTAGLLHNIGKLAMSVWLENKMAALNDVAERAAIPFDEIERKMLGYDHADVGAHLAEKWNLPVPLVTAIKYHHRPSEVAPPSPLTDCVHIGDYLAMSMGLGLSGEGLRYVFDKSTLSRLGLTEADIDELVLDFITAYNQHEKLFEEAVAA